MPQSLKYPVKSQSEGYARRKRVKSLRLSLHPFSLESLLEQHARLASPGRSPVDSCLLPWLDYEIVSVPLQGELIVYLVL